MVVARSKATLFKTLRRHCHIDSLLAARLAIRRRADVRAIRIFVRFAKVKFPLASSATPTKANAS